MSTKNKLVSAGTSVAKNVKAGLAVAGGKKVANAIVVLVKKQLGEQYPAFFSTPAGKMLEPIVIPALLHMLVMVAQDTNPMVAKASKVTAAAVQGSATEMAGGIEALTGPIVTQLLTLLPLIEIDAEDNDTEW